MSAEGPRRLLDGGDELNSLLRGAFDAERADEVDEARLARIGQSLALAGASAAPPPVPSTPPGAVAGARTTTGWLAAKGPYVLLAAALVGGFAVIERTERAPAPAPAPVQVVTVAPAPMEQAPTPATPTFSPADLPTAPAVVSTPAKPASTKGTTTGATSDVDEIALLARAHDVLRSDPAQSLSLCKQHESRFARGHFAQEREAVAIEALFYLGRKDEAGRRWAEFQRRYPSSSHRVHLESLFAPASAH